MVVQSPQIAAVQMQSDIDKISEWADNWLLKFNPAKSESLIVSRKLNKPFHPPLMMDNFPIHTVDSHKHLGCVLSSDGSWHEHINYIKERA